jgi:hypothetical protein
MHDFPEETVPWASADAAAPPDEDLLEMRVWAGDAIHPAHFKQTNKAPARNAPTLVTNLFRYGPYAALTACLFAGAWLAWSHLDGPARTVVQQERVQSAEMGHAAQKIAEELPTQKASVEAMPAAQSLSTKEATDLEGTKPRLDAVKTEITAANAEVSGKVERLPPKPPVKPSKISERFDPIGHEITALLGAAPVADRSISAAVARKRAKGRRDDAFDPSKNPTAPGAPRALGTIGRAATTNSSPAEIAYGQKTN